MEPSTVEQHTQVCTFCHKEPALHLCGNHPHACVAESFLCANCQTERGYTCWGCKAQFCEIGECRAYGPAKCDVHQRLYCEGCWGRNTCVVDGCYNHINKCCRRTVSYCTVCKGYLCFTHTRRLRKGPQNLENCDAHNSIETYDEDQEM